MSLAASVDRLELWADKPQAMVRDLFGVTPDPWQDMTLEAFAHRPRVAMKASKGPGKTCVEAWCAWNFLLTRPHPNIAATSVSGENLRDNLWKEMAHWQNKSDLLMKGFVWQAERIFNREHPATWFMSARNWPKSANREALGNTLAGLHSDFVMFIIDESGSIPVPIMFSAEAAMSSAKECRIIQAGNTNSLQGALYDACVTRKHLWFVVPITGDPDDPQRSSRVSLEWAKEMIDAYGRDNPYVKIMVLGEWPSQSINALLGPEDIEASIARANRYQQSDIDEYARVLGVDVAREGPDASVIFPRQGLVAFTPKVLRNVTGTFGAGQIARIVKDWDADAVFVDNTGGFGSAWIEALEQHHKIFPIPVGFAEAAHDRKRYYNKRTEMHFEAADWVKRGGVLPNCPELLAEACATTYTFKGDRVLCAPKELVKAEIGRSPDHWDAFITTHAEPVQKAKVSIVPLSRRREPEYDPFASYL